MSDREAIVRTYQRTAIYWYRSGNALSIIQIGFGLVAMVLSLYVAAKPPLFNIGDDGYRVVAFFAAICTGIVTFFNASKSANRHTMGYRDLQASIDRFINDQNYNIEKVDAVRKAAQEMIEGRE